MSPVTAFRVLIVSLLVLSVNIPALSEPSETASLRTQAAAAPSNIVIGFVGGFVHHDNPHHGPVKLARQIQRTVPEDTYIRVFENRHRRQAFNSVIRLLDTNHDGILSAEEKLGPASSSSATVGERLQLLHWPGTCAAKACRFCSQCRWIASPNCGRTIPSFQITSPKP